jgi:hypothetical protein
MSNFTKPYSTKLTATLGSTLTNQLATARQSSQQPACHSHRRKRHAGGCNYGVRRPERTSVDRATLDHPYRATPSPGPSDDGS